MIHSNQGGVSCLATTCDRRCCVVEGSERILEYCFADEVSWNVPNCSIRALAGLLGVGHHFS